MENNPEEPMNLLQDLKFDSSGTESTHDDSSIVQFPKKRTQIHDLEAFNGGRMLRDSRLRSIHSAEITSTFIFNEIYNEKKRVNILGRLEVPRKSQEASSLRKPLLSEIILSIPNVSQDKLQETLQRAEKQFGGDYDEATLKKLEKKAKERSEGAFLGGYGGYGGYGSAATRKLRTKFNRSYDFVNHLGPQDVESFLRLDEEYERKMEEMRLQQKEEQLEGEMVVRGLSGNDNDVLRRLSDVVKTMGEDDWKYE